MRTLLKPVALAVDCSGTVTLGGVDSTLADREADNVCINDLIIDTPDTRGSLEKFIQHVTKDPGNGDAVVAFMNPGGIRADITYLQTADEGDGNITYGEAFTVQPFGNFLMTMTLTGAQIEQLLEQQFVGCPNGQTFDRILQVSDGFSYTWDAAGPACDKVRPDSIMLNGMVVDPAASYRVTVNSFLADGGDKFSVLLEGTDRLGGALDLDALEAYCGYYGLLDATTFPNAQGRILRLN